MIGPDRKKNERKGTDDASPDEADGIHRISNQEMTRPRLTQINDVAKENRKDEERLQSNADERTDVESLLCRAIEGKCQGNAQGNIRHVPEPEAHPENAAGRDSNRKPLQAGEPFVENQDAQENTHQRINIIPETGIDDVVIRHCQDENTPVRTDQKAGRNLEKSFLLIMDQLTNRTFEEVDLPEDDQHRNHDEEGPYDPVRQDFIRPDAL